MAFENFYITTKGKRLLAKAQVGTEISFTKAEIGEGVLPSGGDILARTSLVQAVKTLPIAGVRVSKEDAQITMNFSNQGITTPFYWREIGLYATDPDDGEILYAYGYAATNPDYISTYSVGPMEFIFTMVVQIGSAANITAVIDDSLIFCTPETAEELAVSQANAKVAAHKQEISHSFYGVTGGSGSAFTVSIPNVSLQDGVGIRIKLHTNTQSSPTLNVNGTGAKAIRLANWENLNSGIAAGTVLSLTYDGTNSVWMVEGNSLPLNGGALTGAVTAGGSLAVSTPQIRNISAGTADLEAGTSTLATGSLYFVYE